MDIKSVIFDLDGTLTDSGEGITKCVRLALEHFNIPVESLDHLKYFVGPPLRDSFVKAGVPEDKVEEAIAVYRSRYTNVGLFENVPYSGIRELLEKLTELGYRLFVATSKPEEMAVRVLKKFDLYRYFEIVCGATLDKSRDSKSAVIAHLLAATGNAENAIMVGDTAFDVIGAAEHNISTIGVSWGYGKEEEMNEAGAIAIAHTPDELLFLLRN